MHNATINWILKLYKTLLFPSYSAGLHKQEFHRLPWCLLTTYVPQEGGLPKAENAPTWQRCSKEDEKPKNRKCSLDFRISSSIQPYVLSAYYTPAPYVTLLPFPSHMSHWIVILYTSSPQPFWHQGPVSWKSIFPQTGWRGDRRRSSGGNASGIHGALLYRSLYCYRYNPVPSPLPPIKLNISQRLRPCHINWHIATAWTYMKE